MDFKQLLRPNILVLKPYSCARNEFTGEASVYLDANENPYNTGFNRYPDPLQWAVKQKLAAIKGVCPEQIFLGNGSDEAIDLIYRIFCVPGEDNVVAPAPTYGMYEVCADINDVEYRAVPLTADYQLDIEALKAQVDTHTKVIWLCSPNNPTGNALKREDIVNVLEHFEGIVVVDEAYVDFSSQESLLAVLDAYPRLVVLQTFSKAWGQAAVRCGIAYASQGIIGYFNRVKYPYNVNVLTQQHVAEVLDNVAAKDRAVSEILQQRALLEVELPKLNVVECVYPSDANFLLVKVKDADVVYGRLMDKGVIVRNRNSVMLCGNCLRITVGTPEENRILLEELAQF